MDLHREAPFGERGRMKFSEHGLGAVSSNS